MTDLSDLISRVRSATGPDRELDTDIWRALCWHAHSHVIAVGARFTGSIDAAAALCECVIPNFHRWTVGYGNGETFAYVDWRDGDEDNWDRRTTRPAPAPTAPLALTLAVLLAKQEIEQ